MLARDEHAVSFVSQLLVRPTLQAEEPRVSLAVSVLLCLQWEHIGKPDINMNKD